MSKDDPNNPINRDGPEHLPLIPLPKGPKFVLQYHLAITGPNGTSVKTIGSCGLPSDPYAASLSCESTFDNVIGPDFKEQKNGFFGQLIRENAEEKARKHAAPNAAGAQDSQAGAHSPSGVPNSRSDTPTGAATVTSSTLAKPNVVGPEKRKDDTGPGSKPTI